MFLVLYPRECRCVAHYQTPKGRYVAGPGPADPPVLLPLLCWPLAGCASYLRNVLHQPRRGLRAAPSWRGQVPRREAWLHYSPLRNFICRLFLSKAQIDLSAPVKTVFVWFPVWRGASLETGFLNLSVVDYYENKDYDLCLSHLDIFAGQLE